MRPAQLQALVARAAAMGNMLPAATVALLRDAPAGLEVLLLQKSRKVAFSGLWVFPGGKVEPADVSRGEDGEEDVLRTAARAAAREAAEETALPVDPASLLFFSHWLPPQAEVEKRGRGFSTFFFAAAAQDAGAVAVDGGEISTHAWLRPADALERHAGGSLNMLPPTWITLERLSRIRPPVACKGGRCTLRSTVARRAPRQPLTHAVARCDVLLRV